MDREALLASLPDATGTYLFTSAGGEVLYVGKALSIRHRVRSHLQRRPPAEFIALTDHVDYVVTDNEVEALLLEHSLIHQHLPRYNIRLKDDKKYPWIKVTWQEDWPRVYLTRTVRRDGAKYYGPFPNVRPAREALSMIRSVFPVRSCRIPSKDLNLERACIDYEMKRCVAPCIGAVSREDYRALFTGIESVLRGRIDPVKHDLRERMDRAADEQAYERAGFYRDAIVNLEKLQQRQAISRVDGSDMDFIGLGRFADTVCCVVLRRRAGRTVGSECYTLDRGAEASVPEALAAFMLQFYAMTSWLPNEIYLPQLPDEHETLATWLHEAGGHRVAIAVPQRGEKLQAVELACRNAELQATDRYRKLHGIGHEIDPKLKALEQALELEEPPLRIECYDISTIQGKFTVGSMVVFWCGRPQKSSYRRFRVMKVDGPNDFASMQEVLQRRLAHDDPKFGKEPQLIVIDGGLGQLSAAREVLETAGFDHIPLISLAKREELIFRPGSNVPLTLPLRHPGLQLLQQLRDEAHRFAIGYHRQLRGTALTASVLDEISGVGKQRKRLLLDRFGSIDGIRAATVDELAGVRGVSLDLARRIAEYIAPAS